MHPPLCLALSFAATAALGACALHAPLVVRPGADLAALASEDGDPRDHCWIEAGGRRLPLHAVEPDSQAWRGRKVTLELSDPRIPYKCIGGAVFVLQRAGATVVNWTGFISEPRRE
ncbi:MAG TPA: hypothetical protein VGW34_08215 [Allosphingosinicella sp.]|nr:hypothetical protein [Allosphingosinicella sp.]